MVLFPRIYTLSCLCSKPSSFIWSSFQQRNDQPVEEEKKTIIEWSYISSTPLSSHAHAADCVLQLSGYRLNVNVMKIKQQFCSKDKTRFDMETWITPVTEKQLGEE